MKTKLAIVSTLIILTLSLAMAVVTKDDWEKLKAGEVLFEGKFLETENKVQKGEFTVRIFIKADRKAVWKVVRDYENMPEYTPRLYNVTILKKEDGTVYLRYQLKVMWLDITYYPLTHETELYRRVDWETDLTKRNDIGGTTGYWLLEDAPGESGIILHYVSYVDIGYLVPKLLAKTVAKRSLPEVIINMRKRIESGGTWVKPRGT